jgi:hypothetical protein
MNADIGLFADNTPMRAVTDASGYRDHDVGLVGFVLG